MPNRIRFMDGLRALAVLGVLIYHAQWRAGAPSGGSLRNQLFDVGAHGVDLFFVISGFCLAYPYLAKLRAGSGFDFRAHVFFGKRILRIVPPYLAAIALLAVCARAGFYPGVPWPDLVRQAFFIDWGTQLINLSFWSLAVEWRWYFYFAPVLLLYIRRPALFGLLGAASYVAFCLVRVQVADLETLASFFLGIYAADLHVRAAPIRRFALPVLIPALAIGVFALPNVIGNFPSLPLQVASFALIVFTDQNPAAGAVFSHPVLTWIGERSYSIYLVHYPVIIMAVRYAHVAWPVAALLGLVAGIAFWFAVERVVTKKAVRDVFVAWYVRQAEGVARFLRGKKMVSVVARPADHLVERGIE